MNDGLLSLGFPQSASHGVAKGLAGAVASTFTYGANAVLPPGFMGVFGSGMWKAFQANGSITFPAGVTQARIRVVGAAGGNLGAGGGYAHGVFPVSPGTPYAITVASGVTSGTAATSSFGSLISATGGASAGGAAGIGVGGSFQATGGINAGGAGSQLGNGGNGTASGGGGVNGGNGNYGGGGSAFGSAFPNPGNNIPIAAPDVTGNSVVSTGANGAINAIGAIIRFPFDGFTGGAGGNMISGGGNGGNGGPGAGGGNANTGIGGMGGVGGGGGTGTGGGGVGGIGGGGGVGAPGGGGLVVVEW